jgi:hypothetical protein
MPNIVDGFMPLNFESAVLLGVLHSVARKARHQESSSHHPAACFAENRAALKLVRL